MVTTVAPTMPVEAARNAPTMTMDTARPPGSGPNTRAIEVSRSSAIRERSSVMPIMTNISTASSVSMDWPAITRSLIRFTMKEILRSIACSQPPGNTGSSMRGKSGYRNTEIASRATPSATNAANSAEPLSIAWWISNPAESSAAMMAKEMTPAPAMANATGKPVMIPAKSVRKTMRIPTSTPSIPKSMLCGPPAMCRLRHRILCIVHVFRSIRNGSRARFLLLRW